ncbi:hypothetical protein NPIL_648451, partial [Nephila pilipes]
LTEVRLKSQEKTKRGATERRTKIRRGSRGEKCKASSELNETKTNPLGGKVGNQKEERETNSGEGGYGQK